MDCKVVFYIVLCLLPTIAISQDEELSIVIKADNWKQIYKGEWLIKFYTSWCPACRSFESTWNEIASWIETNEKDIKVGQVDVDEEKTLAMRFFIMTLPTIIHVKDGIFRVYNKQRSLSSFTNLIQNETWREIDPIQWYRSPESKSVEFILKTTSYVEKIMDLYNYLVEEKKYPGWAVITILTLTGFIVVTLISFLFGNLIIFLISLVSKSPSQDASKKKDDVDSKQTETLGSEKSDQKDDKSGVKKRQMRKE